MKTFMLAVMLSSVSALPAIAMSQEQFQETAKKVFQPVIKEYDIPGLAVGVSIKGKHFLYTHGHANRETGENVTADTIFELGSISKLFNVTLFALAVQQNKLDHKAPVSDLIPTLKNGTFDRITLTDLATHTTSGLPLQVPSELHNEAELMTWLQNWKPSYTSPMRSYSNISIGLLGYITAKTMDMNYATAAENILFPMLGLSSTFVNVPTAKQSHYAYGYSRNENKPIRVSQGVFSDEAYGVKSTANDMLQFLDVSLGKTDNAVLQAAVKMTQTGYTKTEFYTQDMLWEQYPLPLKLDLLLDGNSAKMVMESQSVDIINPPLTPQRNSFLNKTGSTNGFGGYVALLPSEEIGVVVLANRNYPNEERVKATYKLLEQLNIVR